jgi:hypothetical protein
MGQDKSKLRPGASVCVCDLNGENFIPTRTLSRTREKKGCRCAWKFLFALGINRHIHLGYKTVFLQKGNHIISRNFAPSNYLDPARDAIIKRHRQIIDTCSFNS